MALNQAEFGSLKLSGHPDLRLKYFDIHANGCKNNTDRVIEMANLRRSLALTAK